MNVTKRTNKWQYDFRYKNKRYRKGGFGTKREATNYRMTYLLYFLYSLSTNHDNIL